MSSYDTAFRPHVGTPSDHPEDAIAFNRWRWTSGRTCYVCDGSRMTIGWTRYGDGDDEVYFECCACLEVAPSEIAPLGHWHDFSEPCGDPDAERCTEVLQRLTPSST